MRWIWIKVDVLFVIPLVLNFIRHFLSEKLIDPGNGEDKSLRESQIDFLHHHLLVSISVELTLLGSEDVYGYYETFTSWCIKILEWFLAIIKGIILGLVLLSISVSGT